MSVQRSDLITVEISRYLTPAARIETAEREESVSRHVIEGRDLSTCGEDDEDDARMGYDEGVWVNVWRDNRGALFVLLSEAVGTTMDAMVRYLQQGRGEGRGMHPFQLIFARTSIIFILSTLYMWWTKVPDFLLGKPSVRGWLVLRSICGFMGLSCFYYSIHYLPLAEATIFRFLVPIPTAFLCSILLGWIFTLRELLAGLIALSGVFIIAYLGSPVSSNLPDSAPSSGIDDVTPSQRLFAILIAAIGTFGTVGAYVSIRVIGSRAHALVSVNYFAFLSWVFSLLAILFAPGVNFVMPEGVKEWVLLFSLGGLGFALQSLLTMGLLLDKSSKATSMMYSQIVFALICDWGIWGVVPGKWSWVGGAIVVFSTGWAALMKGAGQEKVEEERNGESGEGGDGDRVVDEESALLVPERTENESRS